MPVVRSSRAPLEACAPVLAQSVRWRTVREAPVWGCSLARAGEFGGVQAAQQAPCGRTGAAADGARGEGVGSRLNRPTEAAARVWDRRVPGKVRRHRRGRAADGDAAGD